nr:auxin transport protein BIG [Tanacetum cinerariifolium]
GDERDFRIVSDGDIPAYMSPGPSYTSPALTAQKSLSLANRRKLRVRRTPLKLKSPMRYYSYAAKDVAKDAAKDTHLDAVMTMLVPMTTTELRDALHKRKVLHDAKREKGEKVQYTMTGFVWAFMIWILEAIPATHRYVHKQSTEKVPRALAWELRIPFSWSRLEKPSRKGGSGLGQVASRSVLPGNVSNRTFWASTSVENMMQIFTIEGEVSSSFLNQLIDVTSFTTSSCKEDTAVECLVKDLVIERYIFMLCWDIPPMHTALDLLPSCSDIQTLGITSTEHLLYFGHSILASYGVAKGENFPKLASCMLKQLQSTPMFEEAEEIGWDFLRSGSWLSLVLSLLELLQALSVLLRKYKNVYHKTLLSTFGDGQSSANKFSPVLLLKHTGFEKSLHDVLFEKSAFSPSPGQLESICELLPKFGTAVDRMAPGIWNKVFSKLIMHGFPCSNQVPSGFLLSSILSIKGIIYVLHGLLKVIKAKEITTIQAEVRFEILESVLSAKTDRSLTDSLEGLDYESFFSLKNMYEFLRDINAQEVIDSSVNECVVSKAVDVIDTIMKDPSRASMLKKFMSDGDVDVQMEDACSSQHGDLLVLINALDNCISESVSGYHLPAE